MKQDPTVLFDGVLKSWVNFVEVGQHMPGVLRARFKDDARQGREINWEISFVADSFPLSLVTKHLPSYQDVPGWSNHACSSLCLIFSHLSIFRNARFDGSNHTSQSVSRFCPIDTLSRPKEHDIQI